MVGDVLICFNHFASCRIYDNKSLKKRKIDGLYRAGRKMSIWKPLVISVCGKRVHEAPSSSMHEPGRLILLKVILEMAISAQKTKKTVLHSSKDLRRNQVSYFSYSSHFSTLRFYIILSHLCIGQTYTFIIHLISLLKIIISTENL